jgi:hypothetical protein
MTMTTEETVAPEQTQNALEQTQNAPEVVTPEVPAEQTTEQKAETEKSDADKAQRAMQRRIDKRTADVYRERAEKEHLAQRLAALEAQVSGKPEQQAEPVDPHALAREIATVERVTEKANGIAKDGEKRFGAEFKTALSAVVDEAGALFDNRGRPTAIGDAILDADDPAALLHHLGKNPDLAAELQDLSPARLGRRIGQIEALMTAKPAPKPVSNAPAPAKPINASTGGSVNLGNATMSEYRAARKAQGATWAR